MLLVIGDLRLQLHIGEKPPLRLLGEVADAIVQAGAADPGMAVAHLAHANNVLDAAFDEAFAAGRTVVTLAKFDDRYKVVYTDRDIALVTDLKLNSRGSTALLDAIGRTITDAEARYAATPEADRPGQVYLGIMTDGYESASRHYTHKQIKELITHVEQDLGWVVLYMGANRMRLRSARRWACARIAA